MTKREAIAEFKASVLPGIVELERKNGFNGRIDRPMRREAWNNYTDALCKAKTITAKQYANWTHPSCCG